MVEWVSKRLALSIKKANPEETASVEVMVFSLILLVNAFAIIVFTLLIGWITGKLPETALTIFSFMFLKFFSGGIHLKSSDNCVLWSTIAMTVIPHIPINDSWILWMSGISLVVVGLFAPAKMNKKARIPEKYYPLLKVVSLLIVASNIFFASAILAKVFLLQALMLIPYKRR